MNVVAPGPLTKEVPESQYDIVEASTEEAMGEILYLNCADSHDYRDR